MDGDADLSRGHSMRTKFIAGNWKMFTTAATARQLADRGCQGVGAEPKGSGGGLPAVSLPGDGGRGAARQSGGGWGHRIVTTKRKAPSPARSARRCWSMSAAAM